MKSIFFKLMMVQLLCAAAATAILWELSDRSFKESMMGEFVTNGQTVAESVASSVERNLAGHDLTSVQSVLDASLKTPDVVWAYVTAPDGTVIADTFVPSFPNYLPPPASKKGWLDIHVPGKDAPVANFTHPLLTGIFGSVHVGFTEEKLIASMNRMKLLLLGTLGVVMFLLAAIVSFVIRKIIAPIHALTRATSALVDDKFEPLPIKSGDEIGVLTGSFNKMMLERQEDRANLEARVLARTDDFLKANKQIAANQRDMRLILDNLEEGLVTINLDGRISGEASRAIKGWFGDSIGGAKLADWIAKEDSLFGEWLDIGLDTVKDGFLPLEVAMSQLPARLKNASKTYEVRYQTVNNPEQGSETAGGRPEKLLVIVTDVTERLSREAAERHQGDLLAVFQHMMRDKVGFLEFLSEADGIVQSLRQQDHSGLEHLKRLVHTLKGNSAIFGMRRVSEICHAVENDLTEQGLAPTEAMDELDQAWRQIRSDVENLIGEAREKSFEIDDAEYGAVLGAVRASVDVQTLARMLESWQMEPTVKRLTRIEQQIKGIAERMGKSHVEVSIEPNDLRFNSERFAPFWSAFVHALRNAVDHGVESREDRVKVGKPEQSLIKVSTALKGDSFVVTIQDDGPGVDWDRLRTKAIQLGISGSASAKPVDLMFFSGLSSKDTVTETSGRGVGMAALADVCEPLGGKIAIESELGVGTRIDFVFPKDNGVYEGHVALLKSASPLTNA